MVDVRDFGSLLQFHVGLIQKFLGFGSMTGQVPLIGLLSGGNLLERLVS